MKTFTTLELKERLLCFSLTEFERIKISEIIDEAYKSGDHDGWYECVKVNKGLEIKEPIRQYTTPDNVIKSIYADPEYRRPELKTYISLKDLPGAQKGTEWVQLSANLWKPKGVSDFNLNFAEKFILANPDWWAEKKQETLESAVEKALSNYDLVHFTCNHGNIFANLRAVYERTKGEKK